MPLSENWENWTEFEWEKFLRQNDARISVFFQYLPRFIDLPAETEMLEQQINKQVPVDAMWQQARFLFGDTGDDSSSNDGIFDSEDLDDEDNGNFIEDWDKREGAEIYISTRQLSHALSILLAESHGRPEALFYTRSLTLLGKMTVLLQIMIEIEPENRVQLRTAICKRIINICTGLFNDFTEFRKNQPWNQEYFQAIIEQLMNMRQESVDLLKKARTQS